MRVVIDAVTPAVKKGVKIGTQEAVKYLTEKGIRKTVESAIERVPGATRRTVRGMKTAGRELRARRGVKTIDAPEVEVKSSEE